MLDTPPVLTIQHGIVRPSQKKVRQLQGALTGNIADCMGGRGALSHSIKPLSGAPKGMCKMVGVALTCLNSPCDQLGFMGALSIAKPGDIIVAATEACTSTAVVGDLMLGIAKNAGVLGVVTDGAVRDLEGIFNVNLPVFASAINPDSPSRTGPGSAGLAINIGGRMVRSGDIIVADRDGVVVVPYELLDSVISKLRDVQMAEENMERKIKNGLKMPESWKAFLEADSVKHLD